MPSAIHGPLGPFVIYGQRDIDEMVRNAKDSAAKYGLTKQGGFGIKMLGSTSNMVNDSIQNPNFKFQHETFAKWSSTHSPTFSSSSYDPTQGWCYIENIIAQEILKKIDKTETDPGEHYYKSMANMHSMILRGAYDGVYFGTPITILQKITHPLKLLLKSNDQHINIYYEPNFIFSKPNFKILPCWIIDVKEDFNIIDPKTNQTWPMKYSIKAVLPTPLDPKSSTGEGFRLVQMTVSGNEKYLKAFDCFLCNNKDWNEELFSLSQLLAPLNCHMRANGSAKSSSQVAVAAILKLKAQLQEETSSVIQLLPNEIDALKQSGPLKDIVWNLGFLIAIKLPELYQRLGIGRNIHPSMPTLSKGYHRIEIT